MNDTSKLPQVCGASQLVRPRYSPGLMLQDDDLRQAVDYTRDLSRLLFKNLFGCGVICGFKVTPGSASCRDQVTVERGVAIDGHGDPIELRDRRTIELGADLPDEMWITIRRHEIPCLKRDLACVADDDDSAMVHTRVRDGYEIRLLRTPPAMECSCHRADAKAEAPPRQRIDPKDDPCYRAHYEAACDCGCGDGAGDVVLARLYRTKEQVFDVDTSVRRVIRPALIADHLLPPPAAPEAPSSDRSTASAEKTAGKSGQASEQRPG